MAAGVMDLAGQMELYLWLRLIQGNGLGTEKTCQKFCSDKGGDVKVDPKELSDKRTTLTPKEMFEGEDIRKPEIDWMRHVWLSG